MRRKRIRALEYNFKISRILRKIDIKHEERAGKLNWDYPARDFLTDTSRQSGKGKITKWNIKNIK